MLASLFIVALTAVSQQVSQHSGIRTIALDPTKAEQKIILNGTLGVATTIRLPEGWVSTPICGDCAFGATESAGQLWRLVLQEETKTLVIQPIVPPSAALPPEEYLTNLHVVLKSGIALVFYVRLVPKAEGDFLLSLTLPEGASSSSRLSSLEKKLEASFAEKVKEASSKLLVQNLRTPIECRDISNKIKRTDHMVVQLRQLCHVGTMLFVSFEVKNRKRTALELGTAMLTDPDDNVSDTQDFDKTVLQFNDTAQGIAAFSNVTPSTPHRTYDLSVAEEGGAGRVVEWTGLHFGAWF